MKTAVAADDDPIRRARLAWIASTLMLPIFRVRQMLRR